MNVVLVLLLVAGLVATVAKLRLRYYTRRHDAAIRQEMNLQAELAGLRSECDRLFWEGAL